MSDLLTALKQLKEQGPEVATTGICGAVKLYSAYHVETVWAMQHACRTWPHFSGDVYFPVPAPADQYLDCYDYYFERQQDLWDKTTEYGQLRWDLLDHLIKELSK